MNFLSGLNAQQKIAVNSVSGAVLVLAGAGTGKTKVITSRICNMIFHPETPALPEKIVALSFTRKAAMEMKERLAALLGVELSGRIQLSTFHSFALLLLREYGSAIGVSSNFKLCDEHEATLLLNESLKELRLQELYSVISARQKIAQLKDEGFGVVKNFSGKNIFDLALLKPLFENYNRRLLLQNSIEFDDVVYLCVKMFVECPYLLEILQNKYTHFLVDEFQDTSVGQLQFIRLLGKKYGNVCVVGDDDQSIYSWRGANSKSIQSFLNTFPDAKSIALEQNYRCSPTILMAANSVIEKNTERQKKTLWSNNENENQIGLYGAVNTKEEAEFVLERILQLKRKEEALRWSDFAVIYRSNAQSEEFESLFSAKNIPFEKNDSDDNFDSPEVKDVKQYLRLFGNPSQLESFFQIVNFPPRGVSLDQMEVFQEEVFKNGVHPKILQNQKISQEIRSFYEIWFIYFARIQLCQTGVELVLCLRTFLKEIQYEKELRSRSSSMRLAEEKQRVLDKFFDRISKIDLLQSSNILDVVLEKYCAPRKFEAWKNIEHNKVQLLTIHSSKGLEFPVVFLVGAEEGILPHEKSLETQSVAELQEERRLCYVAITRAKRYLFVSHCQERYRSGMKSQNKFSQISRFIQDIPAPLFENITSIESSEGARKAELSRKLFDMFR